MPVPNSAGPRRTLALDRVDNTSDADKVSAGPVRNALLDRVSKFGDEILGILTFKEQASFVHKAPYDLSNVLGGLAALEVRGRNNEGAAFMQFHRPGIFAAYFGLDIDNKWKVGGWSTGANAYEIFHEGNTSKATADDLNQGTSTKAITSVADVPNVSTKRPGVTSPAVSRIKDRLNNGSVDLREWSGVDYTGQNDSASVVQRAFNDAMREGFELVSRIPGTLTFGTKLISGTGKPLRFRSLLKPQISPYDGQRFSLFQNKGNACWLYFAHNDRGIEFNRSLNNDEFSTTSNSISVYGNALTGFGTYRDQGDPTANGWTPRDSDFDVSVRNSGAEIDLVTLNTSRFVEFYNADKSTVSLKGQPLIEGIRALYNYDVITGYDIEFWPYWCYHRNVKLLTAFRRVALRTGRADGLYIKRLFDYQGFVTHLVQNAPEVTNKPQFLPGGTTYDSHINWLYADATPGAVQVDPGCDGARVTYDKIIAQSPDSSGVFISEEPEFIGRQTSPILVLSDNVDVGIGHFRAAFSGGSHVQITGNNSKVSMPNAIYAGWNRADLASAPTNFPAFAVAGNTTDSSINIGILKEMRIGNGNPGDVSGMRRPMPVLGFGANRSLNTSDKAEIANFDRKSTLTNNVFAPYALKPSERDKDGLYSVNNWIPPEQRDSARLGLVDTTGWLRAALASGEDLIRPRGDWKITDRLVFGANGQIFRGEGDRTRNRFIIDSNSFNMGAPNVIELKNSCEFSVAEFACVQPLGTKGHADGKGGLVENDIKKYPWLIDLTQNGGRSRIRHIRMSAGWLGINARADQAQGCILENIEDGCILFGLDMGDDGPADYFVVRDWESWVYGSVGTGLEEYTYANPGTVTFGQCDGLQVDNLMIWQKKVLINSVIRPRPDNTVSLTPTFSSIKLDGQAAQLIITAGEIGIGVFNHLTAGNLPALDIRGGNTTIGVCNIRRANDNVNSPLVIHRVGSLILNGGIIWGAGDIHDVEHNGGHLLLSNIKFKGAPNRSKSLGLIYSNAGRLWAHDCYVEDYTGGGNPGYFIILTTNDWHNIHDNFCGGRKMRQPSSPLGNIYNNFAANSVDTF